VEKWSMPNVLQISSPTLNGPRSVWVEAAPKSESNRCCIFLDAELYLERVKAVQILTDLQAEPRIPPTTSVFLSYGETSERHRDYTCNPAFADFLVEELLPWINEKTHPQEEIFLCGLSLSGLAAIHAACVYPSLFKGALSQSPSAWWNDETMAKECGSGQPRGCRFWISVGSAEQQENVAHAPGLFQKTSQVDSCRRLANSLQGSGHEVNYQEFEGGHDADSWAADLPNGMIWLLN